MRRRRLVIVAVIVGGLLWLVLTAITLLSAATHLDRGRDAATAAADALDASTVLAGTTAGSFAEAAAEFDAAHDRLRNPLVAPLRIVPVIGRQVRSIDASSAAAATVADTAARGLRRAKRLADESVTDGPARVRLLEQLADIVGDARRRVDGLDLGPGHALIGPVADARDELAERVGDAQEALRDADTALATVRQLLTGPSRYLLIAANNAEMRGGSGMWLSGGVLNAADGRLDLGEMAPIYALAKPPPGAVPIEDEGLRTHWSWMHPNEEWRGLMGSPRLPASAALAVRMWEASGQQPVDGVLVVDAVGLRALVAATGPVTVNDRRFNAATIERELLHDQYVRFGRSANRDRREVLADVADAVFAALDRGEWRTAGLVEHLATAVRGRHLMAWSADEAAGTGWRAAGMDGDLSRESVAVSLLNRGGNKLDWFTPVTAALATSGDGDGDDTVVTLRVTAANRTPRGEPEYIAGPYPGIGTVEGEYLGMLAVHLPAAAEDVVMSGAEPTLRGSDGPTTLIGGEVRLRRGERIQVVVRFRLPGRHGSLVVEPSARVPAIIWHAGTRRWTDTQPTRFRW